jgi:hypothetical protein
MLAAAFPIKPGLFDEEVATRSRSFSELSGGVIVLGDSIKKAEKDMKPVWMDQIEQIDLRDVKEHMRAVEDALHRLGK